MAGREFKDTAAVVCINTVLSGRGSLLDTEKETKHGLWNTNLGKGNSANAQIKTRVKHTALIISFLLITGFDGLCQGLPQIDSVETVKKMMRNKGNVESLHMGAYANSSKQCSRFLFILKRSTDSEIEALLNDSSACLRSYAYSYLRSIEYPGLRKTKLALQKDSSRIFFISGCVGGNTEVRYVLKRLQSWATNGNFERWMKDYTEHEKYWISFLMTAK